MYLNIFMYTPIKRCRLIGLDFAFFWNLLKCPLKLLFCSQYVTPMGFCCTVNYFSTKHLALVSIIIV